MNGCLKYFGVSESCQNLLLFQANLNIRIFDLNLCFTYGLKETRHMLLISCLKKSGGFLKIFYMDINDFNLLMFFETSVAKSH